MFSDGVQKLTDLNNDNIKYSQKIKRENLRLEGKKLP